MIVPTTLIAAFAIAILPMGCEGSAENSSTGGSAATGDGSDHF